MVVESEIGQRLKKYRLKGKITLQNLAEKTGLTKGYLSKIENTQKAPPVSTLLILSRALNISLSDILGEGRKHRSLCLVKKKGRRAIARDGTLFGYAYQTLAHDFYNKRMEPYILTLPVKVKKNALFQHRGEELMFVLKGTMRFQYGDEQYLVGAGDCVYFDTSVPHYGVCEGNQEVKCLMVIYTPE